MAALEENIELHKRYKKEAKAEMERLLKENEEKDLKIQHLTQEIKNMTEKKASEVKADIQYEGSELKYNYTLVTTGKHWLTQRPEKWRGN